MKAPFNFKTGVEYTNGNAATLLAEVGGDAAMENNPAFLTFKQALEIGMVVRKGEHGVPLKRVVEKEVYNKRTRKKERKRIVKRFTVFHVNQLTELEEKPKDND